MSTASILPLDNDFEEPEEAALRHALGVRQVFFPRLGPENDCLDPRACPSWCHYGRSDSRHEVDPARPYVAYHAIGFGPTVAASLYPGTIDRAADRPYTQAAHIDLHAGQYGHEEPQIDVYLRVGESNVNAPRPEPLRLTLSDAKDLVKALGYLVDVLEGTREPLEVQG